MQVLYIGGAGRSGSTLLDMILGNLSRFFSLGEMRYFWEYITRKDIVCGCGTKLSSCEFWAGIKKKLEINESINLDHIAVLSEELNRTRNLVRITTKGFVGAKQEWDKLALSTEALYHTTWQATNRKLLVDASKAPSHLALLSRISDIDLRVLHLVRDGRAVAYSWSKRRKQEPAIANRKAYMPRRSAQRAILTWIIENVFILKMCRTTPHIIMRYEDFAKDPQGELGYALQELGLEDINLDFLSASTIPLNPTHSVGGNPIRFSKTNISIVSDDEWRHKMHSLTKLSLGAISLPFLSHFGYKL